MEYWIVYDIESGAPLYPGSGTAGTSAFQQLPDGAALITVPVAVLSTAWPNLDLAPLKAAKAAAIDAQAETVRQLLLTPGAGQAMTYLRKEMEARAYLTDSASPAPFLAAEAAVRGITVAELAAEVAARADAWIEIGKSIEALRMGAKVSLETAATLGDIVAAAQVDWTQLTDAAPSTPLQ